MKRSQESIVVRISQSALSEAGALLLDGFGALARCVRAASKRPQARREVFWRTDGGRIDLTFDEYNRVTRHVDWPPPSPADQPPRSSEFDPWADDDLPFGNGAASPDASPQEQPETD